MNLQRSQTSKQSIRNFQQKLINRSICDLMLLDNMADYILDCCSAQAKANTLSLFSVLPIIIVTFIVHQQPTTVHYVLTVVALLIQQILDIANKKQAYRLGTFSFGTYYFDHICDSFAAVCIVYIMGRLFVIENNWLWLCIFMFAVLPFYLSHLSMYYGEYMHFSAISPVSQGLIILQILCILGAVFGSTFFTNPIVSMLSLNKLIILVAVIWLLLIVIQSLNTIVKGDGLQNIFVIFVIGYIVFQMSVIQINQVINQQNNIIFAQFVYSLMLCHSLIIGQLILKYGSNQKLMQISIYTLVFTAYLVIVYAILAFVQFEGENKLALAASSILAIGSTIGYIHRSVQIKNIINQAINQ